ncbi:anthrone oxygenase family protein [Streptomyces sp. DSM 44915]|uniref:Anthrone oxygenase family protein n=1 Tax=Streptomyces chisholmiae TaxID=3075540 RepID=A0ABU2JN38_9ACTN|nr:anthrone oxygenase family protein [Streptomyces sp. DSM 44915]MDT0266410.1 anthrone oxygenase family protein [Streptomyces sp. DSM 44915]
MTVLAALGALVTLTLAAVIAGTFFAFSVSVLPGLGTLGAEPAVAAMRGMNAKILNPLFLTPFVAVPVTAALTGVALLALGHRAAAVAFLAAALLYLLGAFLPTAVVNVPLNEALAGGAADGPERAAALWAEFAPRWTRANALRTVAAVGTVALTGLGLLLWPRG